MYAVDPRLQTNKEACVKEQVNSYEVSCAFWRPDNRQSGELFRNELRVFASTGQDVTEQVFGTSNVDATIPNLMRAYIWCLEQEASNG